MALYGRGSTGHSWVPIFCITPAVDWEAILNHRFSHLLCFMSPDVLFSSIGLKIARILPITDSAVSMFLILQLSVFPWRNWRIWPAQFPVSMRANNDGKSWPTAECPYTSQSCCWAACSGLAFLARRLQVVYLVLICWLILWPQPFGDLASGCYRFIWDNEMMI